jgi:alpha-L-arabinofuranosidase
MKSFIPYSIVLAALTASLAAPVHAANPAVQITVRADQPGTPINPAMWGVFFEDINLGADGGLYAELVKNRSFEFPDAMMGWFKISPTLAKGDVTVQNQKPFNAANPHYLRLRSEGTAPFGISNEGFRGIGVRAGEAYDFSTQIRGVTGSPSVTVELVASDGTTLDSTRLAGFASVWKKHTATLRPKETDSKARLNLIVEGKGTVDLDMVSLFPQKTWKNRPGGLRADMVQMLADLKPGFLRFPGGCIVEGSHLDRRYQWKTTIGPIAERKLLINRWNYEFKHRPAPDYYQSFGLGFYEFFQLSEDIGAEPLPILNCGMACEFNSNELVPLNKLDPYIQDALDLIEFANGPVTSPWGAKRAALGHPQPFNMKLLGIGNEQWGPQYIERLARFTQVLKTKHPEIALVSAAGPSPADERFQFLWPKLRELKADIVDEHCYANPIWFFDSFDRYDKYDRNGPKVFMGEYAAQSVAIVSPQNRNNLDCALSEAAFMTGLERNADVVRMASYAPLFAHVEGWQWTPNLIWADNLRVYGTPNYYVQQLFSRNRGDVVLPVSNNAPIQQILPAGRIGLGTIATAAEFKDVRVTRGDQTLFASDFARGASGWSGAGDWAVKDGAYQQANPKATASTLAGDPLWSDYTLTLKARKLGGSEGFVITVCNDGAGAYAQWYLGGWGNKQHGIQTHFAEQDQLVARVPGSIDTGRWYDIKIALKGARMDCYLDGKLVQSADVLLRRVPALFASATRDEKAGEIILKVVNPGSQPAETTIQLRGAKDISTSAQTTILTSSSLADMNSFDAPAKVAPVSSPLDIAGPDFAYTFKPYSMTVIRVGRTK